MDKKRIVSNKSEKEVAKKYNGKLQLGSGCTYVHKGDVKTDLLLIDDKTFVKPRKSFTLNKDKLWKHFKDGKKEERIGIFRIAFDKNKAVVVIEEDEFLSLIEEL